MKRNPKHLAPILAGLLALCTQLHPVHAAGDADHEAGRRIYNFRCYYCHGYSGDARTLAATYLTPKPRAFSTLDPARLSRAGMLDTVARGRPGTAMAAFAGILKPGEIALVVDFVRREFMRDKARNTRYHTPANGWPDHERNRDAFPFATGALALDTPPERLTPAQRRGKALFLASCVSCHDRARVEDEGVIWEARAVSYPRAGYSHVDPPKVDAMTSATPYARHDIAPRLSGLSAPARQGERLFQANCAFCHAGDGTGRNWIGSFMEPHPRDLTGPGMRGMSAARLRQAIRDGLPNTSMPAWKTVLDDTQIDAVIAYIDRAFHPISGL